MQSKAKTVSDYLKEVPAVRQAVLTKMRGKQLSTGPVC
jgi:hypothetical protein